MNSAWGNSGFSVLFWNQCVFLPNSSLSYSERAHGTGVRSVWKGRLLLTQWRPTDLHSYAERGRVVSPAFLLILIKSRALKTRLLFSPVPHVLVSVRFGPPSLGRNNALNSDDFYRLIGAHLPIERERDCVPAGKRMEWRMAGCWRNREGIERDSFVELKGEILRAQKSEGGVSSLLVSWPTNRAFKWKLLIQNDGLGSVTNSFSRGFEGGQCSDLLDRLRTYCWTDWGNCAVWLFCHACTCDWKSVGLLLRGLLLLYHSQSLLLCFSCCPSIPFTVVLSLHLFFSPSDSLILSMFFLCVSVSHYLDFGRSLHLFLIVCACFSLSPSFAFCSYLSLSLTLVLIVCTCLSSLQLSVSLLHFFLCHFLSSPLSFFFILCTCLFLFFFFISVPFPVSISLSLSLPLIRIGEHAALQGQNVVTLYETIWRAFS